MSIFPKRQQKQNPARTATPVRPRPQRGGFNLRGRLMLDVARGRDVASLMRAGALDGLSIGFKTVRARADRQSGVRHPFHDPVVSDPHVLPPVFRSPIPPAFVA